MIARDDREKNKINDWYPGDWACLLTMICFLSKHVLVGLVNDGALFHRLPKGMSRMNALIGDKQNVNPGVHEVVLPDKSY